MHRTLKEATVKRYHDQSHDSLKQYLQDFLNARNLTKCLKTLQGLTPCEEIIKGWQKKPSDLNSTHLTTLRD